MAINAGGVAVVREHQTFVRGVLVASRGKWMAGLGKLCEHVGNCGGNVGAAVVAGATALRRRIHIRNRWSRSVQQLRPAGSVVSFMAGGASVLLHIDVRPQVGGLGHLV